MTEVINQTGTTQPVNHVPGTPIWTDLASGDLEGSKAFYSGLFGWDAFTVPGPEAGGYTMFLLNGKMAAAVSPKQDPNMPTAWTVYIHTENADATAAKVIEAGGQVVLPPFDVLTSGRMGIFQDTSGAFVAVWQPREHVGFEVVYEPGAYCWAELDTRNLAAAKEFYAHVFGWKAHGSTVGEGAYTEWQLNGQSFSGAMDMPPMVPAEVPSFWQVYFATADCDASVAKAQALGAQILHPTHSMEQGRFAIIQDPQGGVFGLYEAKQ